MKSNIFDRELDKFRDDKGLSKIAVEVIGPVNTIDGDVVWDEVAATYPSSTQEVYTFKLLSVDKLVITINYTSVAKKNILSVLKVFI
jgi:hypothetical protein